jgi:hypothetical protein
MAPPPARLLLRPHDTRQKSLTVRMPAFSDSMTWSAYLEVQGVVRAEKSGAFAILQSTSEYLGDLARSVAAPSPITVSITSPRGPRSFFRDSVTPSQSQELDL